MTEGELRDLVRESIARHMQEKAGPLPAGPPVHLHPSHGVFPLASGGEGDGACLIEPTVRCNPCHSARGPTVHLHPSHGVFPLASGGEGDGACLIEPTVRCNHCHYCQSYG